MVKRIVDNNGPDGVGSRNFELKQVDMEGMVMVRSVDGKLRGIMRWIAICCFAVDARITNYSMVLTRRGHQKYPLVLNSTVLQKP
jgi:hypothetical protein